MFACTYGALMERIVLTESYPKNENYNVKLLALRPASCSQPAVCTMYMVLIVCARASQIGLIQRICHQLPALFQITEMVMHNNGTILSSCLASFQKSEEA